MQRIAQLSSSAIVALWLIGCTSQPLTHLSLRAIDRAADIEDDPSPEDLLADEPRDDFSPDYTHLSMSISLPSVDPVRLSRLRQVPIAILNSSSQPLSIANLSIAAPYFLVSSDCSILNPNKRCEAMLRFEPTSPGQVERILTVGFDSDQAATQAVMGAGVNGAPVLISTIDFGLVSDFTLRKAIVRNIDDISAIEIGSIIVPQPFQVIFTDCAALGPGEACSIILGFAPTSFGEFSDTLTIHYRDDVSADQLVTQNMKGKTAAAPHLELADAHMGAVQVGTTTIASVAITNYAAIPAIINSLRIAEGPFSLLDASACRLTLAPGESCTVAVAFSPPAAGDFAYNLVVDFDDGAYPHDTALGLIDGAGVFTGS